MHAKKETKCMKMEDLKNRFRSLLKFFEASIISTELPGSIVIVVYNKHRADYLASADC